MGKPFACFRKQIRRVDEVAVRDWGIPGLVLMENAGRGAADVMCELGVEGKVVIACAKGNNGGDGFVLARHLCIRGLHVDVLMCCKASELTGDAKATYGWLQRCDATIHWLPDLDCRTDALSKMFDSAEWVVDALLGTGVSGSPRSPLDLVINKMNSAQTRRLAIDVPSGLDCDTGVATETTFRADHTCTFVAPKIGFSQETALEFVGAVHCKDIGLPWNLVEPIVSETRVEDK